MLYLLLTVCALGAGGWAWFERPNFSPDRVQLDGEWVIVDHPAWGGRGKTRVRFNSPQWQAWLCKQKQLRLTTARGYVYLQREKRGKHEYWYGYRWSEHGTQASRCYFGRIEQMSAEELAAKIRQLNETEAEARARREAERVRRRKLAKAEYDRQRRQRIAARKSQQSPN